MIIYYCFYLVFDHASMSTVCIICMLSKTAGWVERVQYMEFKGCWLYFMYVVRIIGNYHARDAISVSYYCCKNHHKWLKTTQIYYPFCRSEVCFQCLQAESMLRSKSRCWQRCSPFWRLWGKICFQAHSGFWLNSVPCGCKIEVQFPCWLSVGAWSLPRGYPLSFSCFPRALPPTPSKCQVPFMLQISLWFSLLSHLFCF